METIFMNTENSKTNESYKFVYQFTYKLNLKNPNNKTLDWLNLHAATVNLKYLLQLGMVNLNCMIIFIQFQTFKVTLNLSSKMRNFD